MYVMHYRNGSTMVHELDKKGLVLAKRAYPNHEFRVISGIEAHRWVREGGLHTTPLYINNGRIRYARDAS